MSSKVRTLLSAYACEPRRGSEPGVGWNVAMALSNKVNLTVVTRANNQHEIENSDEEWVSHVKWIYHDLPPWMMWWKKGGRGVQLYYILWQTTLFIKLALKGEFKFYDVVHHITFGKYWVPTFLSLSGLPTVFGPVGGGEDTPDVFQSALGKRGLWEERARKYLRLIMTWNPISFLALKLNSVNIAATPQTEERMRKLGLANIIVMPQSAVSGQQLSEFEVIANKCNKGSSSDVFVASCVARLVSWKAIHIAIEAFGCALPKLPVGSYLNIVGSGPEKERLVKLVNDQGLENSVRFIDRLPELTDVFDLMAASDCLMHPALHEAFGQACLESIAVGTPVVCWDWAGPGRIVSGGAGIAVSFGRNKKQSIQKFSEAILLIKNLSLSESQKLSRVCEVRATEFTWDKLTSRLIGIYQNLCCNG